MEFNSKNLNRFLLFKLPSAYFTGIRIIHIDNQKATLSVQHKWINQNPFRSMYFGVQAMAAEISTGVLVMKKIHESKIPISMLVLHQKGDFTKKATGKITFTCHKGDIIDAVIEKAIESGESQKLILQSIGTDEKGDKVSTFEFHWGIKVKK